MAELSLALLGAFEARRPRGAALALPKKTRALLAYLALTPGHACPRGELAALLWGDTGEAQARQSFRQALRQLRATLGPRSDAIRVDGDTVALDPKAFDVDTASFEQLIADGGPDALERALALYRGELLAGLDLDEKPFEDWLLGQRERLRERALSAATRLLTRHTEAGAANEAVRVASRVLAIDPLHERAHRALMRFHATQGRRSAALRQYQVCVDVLQRELRVEPEVETKQLYQEIVRERAAPAPARTAAGREARRAPLRQPAVTETPAPFVGRDAERGRLGDLLDEANRGRGCLTAVFGEAGIGKTRLVSWMAETATTAGARVLVGRAYASEQIVPLGPWSDALRGGIAEDPDLLGGLDDRWRGAVTRLLPELRASWPMPIDDDPIRFFEGVVQLVMQLADARPLLVVLEDLHWADEISLRLLAVVSRRLRTRRVVIVATAREEELADNAALRDFLRDVGRDASLHTIALKPLSQLEIAALVRATAHLGDAGTVERLVARVWATSEGHPFMALETVHALEQGMATSASMPLALSERVREIVTSRLERISERGQQLLAAAAVIGRDFEFPLLERAAGLGELEAAAGVEELVRRRLLRVVEERFAFTHDWIREVTYDQLLPPRRRLLHRHVAAVMESLYADHLEPHIATLGRHWYEAGEWQKAASCLYRAGCSAMERSASHEAAASLTQALDALRRVPETPDTLAEGVDIRLELRNALLLAQHIERLSDLLDETQLLAERLGDPARLAHVSVLRSHYLWWTGHSGEALRLARDAQAVGERLGDRSLAVAATAFVWSVLQTSGDYRGVEAVVEAFKRQHHDADLGRQRLGLHTFPSVSCRCHLAVALGRRGQFDRAYANVEEARIVAEQADHRHSLIVVYWALGEVHITRGAVGEAVDALERALGLCREWEVPLVRPACLSALGYTYVLSGRVEEGMSQLREALASMEIMGWAFSHSLLHIRLAEACLLSGRFPEALEVAQRALTLARERHERGFEARGFRLLADIAVRRDPLDVAVTEDLYRQTRALAAELDMQPLIGHVDLGLALLYRRCARYEEAHAHLTAASTVYAERDMPLFRERAETEARALAAAEG